METVPDFILFDSKITACGDCRNKIKRLLLLQDSCDKPRQCIIKHRHYFADKGLSSQSYGFSSIMYICESWTIKKAEHQIIDHFKLWCWRKLLRVPWTARKSTLNIHWKDWCWSWSFSNLSTWCKELTHWKRLWCWERLRAGEEGDRGWDGWMASLTRWTWVWASSRR